MHDEATAIVRPAAVGDRMEHLVEPRLIGVTQSDESPRPEKEEAQHIRPSKEGVSPVEPDVRRINVNFSRSAYTTLEELAKRRGKSLSDVLRDAIQLEKWLTDAHDEGWHTLLEKDGRVRELARIW